MKENVKGITLIALVVTIIVLLILAAVSINLTVGENGIFVRAQESTKQTDIASTREQIQLELMAREIENLKGYTVEELVEAAKNITGNDVDLNTYIVTSETGNDVDLTDLFEKAIKEWKYTEDETGITNGLITLKIGDIVYYNAVTDVQETTYTSKSAQTGYESDQTFTLAADDNDYTWKVMGVDEDTGEVLIVLANCTTTGDNYIITNDNEYYYLSGQNGYANGVSELNNICSIFGQGEGATGARSITADDVNRLTGYEPKSVVYGSGKIYAYGNEVEYTRTSSTEVSYSGSNNVNGTGNYSKFSYYNGKIWIDLDVDESAKLTSDYYYYSNYSNNSELVYPSSGYYWLGSSYILCYSGYVGFGMRYVYTNIIDGCYLYGSNGTTGTSYIGVRPVVILSSAINFSGSSEDGWYIE